MAKINEIQTKFQKVFSKLKLSVVLQGLAQLQNKCSSVYFALKVVGCKSCAEPKCENQVEYNIYRPSIKVQLSRVFVINSWKLENSFLQR